MWFENSYDMRLFCSNINPKVSFWITNSFGSVVIKLSQTHDQNLICKYIWYLEYIYMYEIYKYIWNLCTVALWKNLSTVALLSWIRITHLLLLIIYIVLSGMRYTYVSFIMLNTTMTKMLIKATINRYNQKLFLFVEKLQKPVFLSNQYALFLLTQVFFQWKKNALNKNTLTCPILKFFLNNSCFWANFIFDYHINSIFLQILLLKNC